MPRHDCRHCADGFLGRETRDRYARPGRFCLRCKAFNENRTLIERDERAFPEIFKMYRDVFPPNGRGAGAPTPKVAKAGAP